MILLHASLALSFLIADHATPQVWEADAFIVDRATIRELLGYNRCLQCHYEQVLTLYPGHEATYSALCETRQLYRLWDALDDAKAPHSSLSTKRTGLLYLRKQLGQEAFERGMMPPHVSAWRMGVVR